MPGMRSLPLAEIPRLMATLPPKYACLAAIGVTTGCRITEILLLRRFDLLTRDGELKDEVSFVKLKNNKKATGKPQPKLVHRKLSIPAAYRPYILRHLEAEELRGY